jgi:hypothetical protein
MERRLWSLGTGCLFLFLGVRLELILEELVELLKAVNSYETLSARMGLTD